MKFTQSHVFYPLILACLIVCSNTFVQTLDENRDVTGLKYQSHGDKQVPTSTQEKLDVKLLRIVDDNGNPRMTFFYSKELEAVGFTMNSKTRKIRESYVFDDGAACDFWLLEDGTKFYSIQSLPDGTSSIKHMFRNEKPLLESKISYGGKDSGEGEVVTKETSFIK